MEKKSGTSVTATCSSTRSPVQYLARQNPEDLWVVPAGFRPTQTVTATVTGARHVNSDGSDHTSTATHSFDLQVATDGAVRYVDNSKVDHVGYLRYDTTLNWQTSAAAVTPASQPTLSLLSSTTSGLNVRTGPGSSHARLATIAGGSTTAYPIVGRHGTPTWWQIEYSSSITGWVHGNYVSTAGDAVSVPATWTENTYLNQTLHHDSHFELERIENTVTGHFTTSRSPVQYSARQNPEDLFTVPDGFRPASAYTVTVTGARHVNSDGSDHTNTATHSFDLTVSTNGAVRYVNNSKVDHVGYLRYRVDVSWTATARSTAPGAPTNFEVDDKDHESLDLDWQAPGEDGGSPITGYRIERWQNGTWQSLVANTGATRTAYDLTGLAAATSYTLRVRAINAVGAGTPSSSLQVQTHAAPPLQPGAPTNVGGHTTHNSVTLTWDAPAQGTVTGYRIRRQLHPSQTWTLLVEDTGETLTRWVDTNQVAASSTYRYEVRARNGTTVGNAGIGNLTTRAQPTTAGAPTALSVAQGNQSQLTLTWTAPTSNGGADLTGYRIERAEDATPLVWQTAEANTANTATTWSETGLAADTSYHYRIAAHNAAGVGTVSGAAKATTRPQLALKSDGTYPLSAYAEPDAAAAVTASFPLYESWRRLDLLAQVPNPNGWWRGLIYGPNVTGPFWLRQDQVVTHGATSSVPEVPAAPTNLGVSASQPGGTDSWRITLTWDNPMDNSITGYQLWRRTDTAAATLHVADMGNVFTWTDTTNLNPGSTYTYQVRALNAHGGGPRSQAGAATLPSATPQLSLKATTTAGLNVRSGPGTTHGIVGTIAGGSTTRYNILGKDAATATWYQIQYSNTVTGWVHKNYVQTHGDLSGLTVTWSSTPQLSLKATTTANLNVRSGPGTTHGIVGSITGGSTTRYNILGKDAATATWYQIQYSNTVTGWVHKNYVQTHGDISGLTVTWTPPQLSLKATTTANLNVRSGPGTTHGIVGSITGGSTTRYNILGKDAATATWYQIQYSNTVTGWVHKNYVQTHGDISGLTVTWTPPQLSLKATTTANLNVRSGPGTTHGIVGTIAGGSTSRYNILGKDAATATWYQIQYSSTVTGWVHANYVQTHGDVSGVPIR